MSLKTLKVRELINILLDFNLDADVYIVDNKGTQHILTRSDMGWSSNNGADSDTATRNIKKEKESCNELSFYLNNSKEENTCQ